MPTLTAYQIQLARDIETIQEALAAGFVIPDVLDVDPPAPATPIEVRQVQPKENPQPVFRPKSEAELIEEMKAKAAQKTAQQEAEPGEPTLRFDP